MQLPSLPGPGRPLAREVDPATDNVPEYSEGDVPLFGQCHALTVTHRLANLSDLLQLRTRQTPVILQLGLTAHYVTLGFVQVSWVDA